MQEESCSKKFCAPCSPAALPKQAVLTTSAWAGFTRIFVAATGLSKRHARFAAWGDPQVEGFGCASSRSPASTGNALLLPRAMFSRSIHAWTWGNYNASGPLRRLERDRIAPERLVRGASWGAKCLFADDGSGVGIVHTGLLWLLETSGEGRAMPRSRLSETAAHCRRCDMRDEGLANETLCPGSRVSRLRNDWAKLED
jgi:hypothetical protein